MASPSTAEALLALHPELRATFMQLGNGLDRAVFDVEAATPPAVPGIADLGEERDDDEEEHDDDDCPCASTTSSSAIGALLRLSIGPTTPLERFATTGVWRSSSISATKHALRWMLRRTLLLVLKSGDAGVARDNVSLARVVRSTGCMRRIAAQLALPTACERIALRELAPSLLSLSQVFSLGNLLRGTSYVPWIASVDQPAGVGWGSIVCAPAGTIVRSFELASFNSLGCGEVRVDLVAADGGVVKELIPWKSYGTAKTAGSIDSRDYIPALIEVDVGSVPVSSHPMFLVSVRHVSGRI